jgi:uncharacterized repeat protein (TIGR03803 family)
MIDLNHSRNLVARLRAGCLLVLLLVAASAPAQNFTTLYSFTATSGISSTNSDGANPYAGLILSGNTLYGTANQGGTNGNGTVFAVNTDGTGFKNLYSFTADPYPYTNSDGANPRAELILSGNTLYGTASAGGTSANGTVFAVNTDGTGFTNLYNFSLRSGSDQTNSDGANPRAGLILSGNTLYGTAYGGGSSGYGTVFAVSTNGTGFTNLYNFSLRSGIDFTNSDGAAPAAGLILSGNTLYGTASTGGSSGNGSVFAVSTNGTGFTNLHSFTATSGISSTNSDGANPFGGLILSGNTLYGTAANGGSANAGTVFAVNTDGSDFTNLYSFTELPGFPYPVTNSDGASPEGLILSGNTLYGTAYGGGSSGYGMVFSLSLPRQFALYASSSGNNAIYKFDKNGQATLFATNGVKGAVLSAPTGLALDKLGNLYVVNSGNATVEIFDPQGNGTVFAHTPGAVGYGVALDANNNVYVANSAVGNSVLKITNPGDVVSVFVGGPFSTNVLDPKGLAFDTAGNLFVANSGGFIEKFDPQGNGIKFATLNQPIGLAFDSASNLYVSLYSTSKIVKYDALGNPAVTNSLTLHPYPYGIAMDTAGNLYVAGISDSSIEKRDPQGNITVFASSSSGLSATAFIAIQETVIAPFSFTGITSVQGGIKLNWPPNLGLVLQQNDDLVTPNWTTVTNPPTLVNGQNQVILSPANDHGFYRLMKP